MKRLYITITVIILRAATLTHAESYQYHTVKDGETLWRISKNYNVAMDKICEVNKITDATKVKQGLTLKIPVDAQTTKPSAPKTAPDKSTSEKKQSAPAASAKTAKSSKSVDLQIPMVGNVKPFITPNTKGIIIFQNESQQKNVVSSDAGTVSYVNDLPGYGLSILIKHQNNLVSVYSGFSGVSVKQGDTVKRGQIIGNAGRLSKYDKVGIIFSVQKNHQYLKYDTALACFTE